ncbi:Macrophage mannose receptor 1 [Dissostichus eleginoides]|uniref:Macrophage mannose receptor 1 n=1 Tax=Dissostichus eleginoides TaxID=100907 RepID=A0AAD9B7P1_DISEL|nr:Macrophage mannose receptor 1 [Dissostichus eleginoides]
MNRRHGVKHRPVAENTTVIWPPSEPEKGWSVRLVIKYGSVCSKRLQTPSGNGRKQTRSPTSPTGQQTLVLVKRKKTWDQALRHCRLLEAKNPQKPVNLRWNYRYELASVLTPDDRAYARLRAGEASTDQVWTGLRLLAGQWFWTGDGEAVQDVDEEMQCGRTQSFCGVLVKNSTKSYETEDCSKKLNFLCYRKP